ncbi:unnamed protein product [Urochloa humidicola]
MALWNGLGQAATLAQLAGVDAGGLISMIIHAAQTVQQNKEECRQLTQDVTMISGLVQLLQQLQMMRVPVIRVYLEGLEDTLRQVYILVTSCQQSNIMYRFFMAGNQAKKFRDVREKISRHLQMYPMISHTHTTYLLAGLYILQPQALEQLESLANHANPDSRSGVNSEITISATGREAHCAPLSEFTLSTVVATTQHFLRESITEGDGHSQVYIKQKIVIKCTMASMKSLSRAMTVAVAASVAGIYSVTLVMDDALEVIAEGVDTVCLINSLRKVGQAEIAGVEVKDKVAQPVVVDTEEAGPVDKTASRQQHACSSGGLRPILTKISKFMWPRARRSVSRPPPSPLQVEHTSNPAPAASGGQRSHLFSAPSTSTAVGAASPPAYDELAAVEAGCVLEDYVAMFDGPMPPAVIASLAGALFHADDESSTL